VIKVSERPDENSTLSEVARYMEEGFWNSFTEGIESDEEDEG
jgi:hypothetical protein